jgi:hypothetical protein
MIPLRDIQSIQISENVANSSTDTQNSGLRFNINHLKSQILDMFFNDIKTPEDFSIEEITSATLSLKFSKKGIKKNNHEILDTALRIIDSDDIVIVGKDQRKIRGTAYFIKASRNFERTDAGYFNEPEVETAMREIIRTVKKGDVVS